MDRGAEMNEATHTVWTQIHNAGVLELEKRCAACRGTFTLKEARRRASELR